MFRKTTGLRHRRCRTCRLRAYLSSTGSVVLVANGSDVALLVHAAEALKADDIKARVVSVPSAGLFGEQSPEYRDSVLPAGVPQFGLTSGLPAALWPVMSGRYEVMGLERFGASAPAKVLEEKFG